MYPPDKHHLVFIRCFEILFIPYTPLSKLVVEKFLAFITLTKDVSRHQSTAISRVLIQEYEFKRLLLCDYIFCMWISIDFFDLCRWTICFCSRTITHLPWLYFPLG